MVGCYGPDIWTGNGTEYTIAFHRFWDADYAEDLYNGDITTLYPEDVPDFTDEMKKAIEEHFYYRQIADETPQRFLRHFQNTIRTRAYNWKKLLESEKALRDDDMIYNYDLTETASGTREDASQTGSQGASTNTNYMSDTPDGNVEDIENYMSEAGKSTADSNAVSSSSGTARTASQLRRYGNIGVMTAAQIAGGYRQAMEWSAYNVIYADLEKHFLGVF